MTRVACLAVALTLTGTALAPAGAGAEQAALIGSLGGHWRCTDSAGTVSLRSSQAVGSTNGSAIATSRVDVPEPDGTTNTSFEQLKLRAGALTVEASEGDGTGTADGSATIRLEGRDPAAGTPFVLTYAFADRGFRRTVTGATPSDVRCTPEPQTPAPATCAAPNAEARTIHAVEPYYSADAIAQHVSGDVLVVVTLDDRSQVLWTKLLSSDSPTLDSEAIRAARDSTYAVEVRNCRPVVGEYVFTVSFRNR